MLIIQILVFAFSMYYGIVNEFSLLSVGVSFVLMLINFVMEYMKIKEFEVPLLTENQTIKSVYTNLFVNIYTYLGCTGLITLLLYKDPNYVFLLILIGMGLTVLTLHYYSIPILIIVYAFFNIPTNVSIFVFMGYTGYWLFMLFYLILGSDTLTSTKAIIELMGIGKYKNWLTTKYLSKTKNEIETLVKTMNIVEPLEPSSDLINRKYTLQLDIDETFEYLTGLEKEMVKIYNEKVTSTYENVPKVNNNQELLQRINELEQDRLIKLSYKNKWKHATLKKLLKENGYNHGSYEAKVNKVIPHFHAFVNSILIDGQDNTLSRDLGVSISGVTGEKALMKELNLYTDLFAIDHSVRIEYNGNSVESDVIIYSKKGIFTLEAKNYGKSGKYGLHISKDGQWRKVYSNGKSAASDDVISQATRHVVIKQKFLNEELQKRGLATTDKYITLESMIVIVNDVVQITNETDYPILRISQIYNYIQKLPDIYTQEEVDNIKSIFDEYKLSGKKYPTEDYAREFSEWLDLTIPLYDVTYNLQPLLEAALVK